MRDRLSLCLCGVLLTGCVSVGNPSLADETVVAQIKVGETTKDQVASLLGEPSHKRSFLYLDHTREWWSYTYSSYMGNPWGYVPLYGLFIYGIGTADTRRELNIFYSPEGVVATLSHMTTSYDLSGPYKSSKVTSVTKIDTIPSGFGNSVHFEDRVDSRTAAAGGTTSGTMQPGP